MRTLLRHLLVIAVLLPCYAANAQEFQVTGRVTDAESGDLLPGVNIVVQGTAIGTTTGPEGEYALQVPSPTDTLVYSFVGFVMQEVPIAGRSEIDVALGPNVEAMEEVVVVGYGTVQKRNLTGAVSQMDFEKIEERSITRVEQALAGQMPGVQVRQVTGEPGEPLEVRVRGGASISAGNEPLYVIDGVPVEDLGNLNPQDVESIEVLKDAASAAIYGSRGANGVVLVTTKNGIPNQTRFQFGASYGIQTLENKLDLLSAEEWIDVYMELQNAAWVERGLREGKDYKASDPVAFRQQELGVERSATYIPDPRWLEGGEGLAYIDWQDEFYQPAPIASYSLSGSGGTDNLLYRISGNYLDQEGIAAFTGYERLALRANLDAELNDRVRMGLNLAPSISWSDGGNVNGKDQQAHRVVSIAPVAEAEADGGLMTSIAPYDRYYWAGSPVSPVGFQQYATNTTERKDLFSKLNVGVDLFSGLLAEVSGAWNSNSLASTIYYPTMIQRGNAGRPEGERSDGRYRTIDSDEYLLQSMLNYNKQLGGHSINAVAGSSLEYYNRRDSYQRHTQFSDDFLEVINDATSVVRDSETGALERSLVSFLGRVIYNYKGRYLASASFRRDGSSKFGEGNKWGSFPSFSLGWRVSDERFLNDFDWLSNLKLRYSWGITGNNRIPDYVSFGRLGVYNYSFSDAAYVGYGPSSLSNPFLGWEQTRSSDIGLELGLFDDRLAFTADYYHKLTSDLLLEVPVARATGFAEGWQNIGKVMNEGLELELTGRTFGQDFSWEVSGNIAFNRNEVVKLGPGDTPIYTGFSGQTAIIQVGEPLMAYYMYDAIGVYMDEEDLQNSPHMEGNIVGDVKYRDVNGDGVITAADRTILGHRNPTYTWGFYNSIFYKSFDLSFLLQGQGGNMIYGILGRAIDRPGMGTRGNKLGVWRDRWRSEEDPGDGVTPRIDGTTGSLYDSRWLYDASYFRLRNVTLGYTLPEGMVRGVGSARIYLSGENLFLYHHYDGGYSPEAENNSGGDYGGYPIARSYTLGINFSF